MALDNPALIWIVIIGAIIAVVYFYKQGKIPWLKGIKLPRMPRWFGPRPDDLTEKLKAQTEKEVAKAEELRAVLEAKRELAKARAENIKLRKEIDGVSERSVEREKRDAVKVEQEVQEAQKVKPRRL